MNRTTYSFQCKTSNIQLCKQLVLCIIIYCINTCFVFMNIKPKGIAFWLLRKLCLTKETDLILYFSHQVFWFSRVLFCLVIFLFLFILCDFSFLFFFLPKSSDLVFWELFQRTRVNEVEGKATPKVQFWIKLKIVLVIQVLWINVFYKTESDAR